MADSEVVVLREHLDQDGSLWCEAVPFDQRGKGLLGKRDCLLAHHRDFVRMELEDQIAILDGLELVERVQQRQ
jgi:hypothetical protein